MGVDEASISPRLRDSVCREFVVPRARFPLDPAADADTVRRLYAAGVLRMDAWLGTVFDALDRLGLTENTTVVLTADHGDELLERGHVGHASTAEHASLHEEVLRIPLFVLDARIDGPRRRTERVQGVDLFPTLLGLAGLSPPEGAEIDGFDLSGLALGRAPAPPLAPAPVPARASHGASSRAAIVIHGNWPPFSRSRSRTSIGWERERARLRGSNQPRCS